MTDIKEDCGLVSIVTPAFNASRYIGETIRSVAQQTYANWEMLVVDDCSRDDTCRIVEDCASRDPRIRLLRQSTNGGPGKARDAAVLAARGRYVAFLDSDDIWLPQKLDRQLSYMRKKDAAVSYTAFRRISEDGTKLGTFIAVPRSLNYRALLKNTGMATSTVLVDRERTGDFRMTDTFYDDYVLWLGLLKRGVLAVGLQEDLVRYRVLRGSWSRNKLRSAMWVWRIYRDIEKLQFADAAWCFLNYACRGVLKYRSF